MPEFSGDLLRGRRILIVEDEYLIAEDLRYAFESLGAEVIGLAPSVEAALALIASERAIDGVTLDVTLGRAKSFPVAEKLIEKGWPFVLLTGYEESALPEHLRRVPRCQKPADPLTIARALFG